LITVLPHEIAHLIFRDFIGIESKIPLWLDEGVAQWAEEGKKDFINQRVKECLEKRAVLPLSDMMDLDVRHLEETNEVRLYTSEIDGKPAFVILDRDSLIRLYYLQAVSLTTFLIEEYGSDRFTDFCRQIRDRKPLEEALSSAYALYLEGIEDLELKWFEYLRKQ